MFRRFKYDKGFRKKFYLGLLALMVGMMILAKRAPDPAYMGMNANDRVSDFSPDQAQVLEEEEREKEVVNFDQAQVPGLEAYLNIPDKYDQLEKEGHALFINKDYQIQVEAWSSPLEDYNLIFDENYYLNLAGDQGLEYLGLDILSNNEKLVTMRKPAQSPILKQYYTTWDFGYCIYLEITIPERVYTAKEHEVQFIINSLDWRDEEPIPSDLLYLHNPTFGFTTLLPLEWSLEDTPSGLFSNSPDGLSFLEVSKVTDSPPLEELTQEVYLDQILGQRANKEVRSFVGDGHNKFIRSTYVNGNTQITIDDVLRQKDRDLYNLRIEMPTLLYKDQAELVALIKQHFRIQEPETIDQENHEGKEEVDEILQ